MLRKILVPTDGSDLALQAARYARELAAKFGSELLLVHVIQNYYTLPAFSMPDTVTIPLSVLQDLENSGQTVLEKTREQLPAFAGKLETRIEYGPPGKQIVEIAAEEGVSLIVMGRRGISGVTGFLLGSVSNHVVHYAPCPVLIIKGNEPLP
ncbi:MAG TPA: universal stress protein [Selenomonadales bacterium]|nr:universal stress protein [Selenomonadales bacterium]